MAQNPLTKHPNKMAVPINSIGLGEIKAYFPVTSSLTQDKIDENMNYVRNITFMEMFGVDITSRIFSGDIAEPDLTENKDFIGFRKFVALCIAANFAEESHIHTNAGLKLINQPNWSSPKAQDKVTTLVKLNNAIEKQFQAAKRILESDAEKPDNDYDGYSSFNFERI